MLSDAPTPDHSVCSTVLFVLFILQSKSYADAEDAEFQLGADLEERGGMIWRLSRYYSPRAVS